MENPQTKEGQQERVISLKQDFQLFSPDRIKTVPASLGQAFWSNVTLILNDGFVMPFDVLALSGRASKATSITPFDPEAGYQIDSEDLVLGERIKKFEMLWEKNEQIDFAKASNFIEISCPFERIKPISQNRLDTFKQLRLWVVFPSSRFESCPNQKNLKPSLSVGRGSIKFTEFYPLDTGPLPTDGSLNHSLMGSGFSLFTPPAPKKLSQIRARFVLAQELVEKET